MHANETIEVAALLCVHARGLLEDSPRLPGLALSEYWAASRCRLDAWGRALQRASNNTPNPAAARPAAIEVLAAQPLTRVVAALAVAHDRRHGVDEAGPIARNLTAAQADAAARFRGRIGVLGDDLPALRRRVERWTDLLLGSIAPLCGSPSPTSPAGHAIEFAFDPARVQEFAYDTTIHATQAAGAAATGPMLLASLRAAFPGDAPGAANPDLNRRIAGAAIGLFGPEAFDDHGLLRSTLTARLERTTDETFGLVEQLFDEPSIGPPDGTLSTRW